MRTEWRGWPQRPRVRLFSSVRAWRCAPIGGQPAMPGLESVRADLAPASAGICPAILAELAQERNHLPDKWVSRRKGVRAERRPLADFAECRVGRDPLGHGGDLEALRNRQRPDLDELAGVLADDAGAENAALLVGDDLDEPFGRPLGLGAVVLMVRPAKNIDRAMFFAGDVLGEPDLGQLRIGICDPGNDVVVDLGGQPEQGAAEDDARHGSSRRG